MATSPGPSRDGLGSVTILPRISSSYQVRPYHLVGFVVAMTISGQCFVGSQSASVESVSFIVAYLVMATAYMSYTKCTNVIVEAIPFSGGAFGLARVSLGFFAGFLVSWAEWISYLMNAAHATTAFGDLLTILHPSLDSYQPLLWFFVYTITLVIHLLPHAKWWRACVLLLCVSICCLLLLLIVTSSASNTSQLIISAQDSWMILPNFARCFFGIDCLHLCCDDIHEPTTRVPLAKSRSLKVAVLTSTALLVLFVLYPSSSSVPFPILLELDHPSHSFLILLPATIILAICWQFCAHRVLAAMAASRLVSRSLRARFFPHNAPVFVIFLNVFASYCVNILSRYVPSFSPWSIGLVCCFCSQFAQCFGFLYLFRHFKHLNDEFKSWKNVFFASYSMFVWLLGFASIFALPSNNQTNAIASGGIFLFAALYYKLLVKGSQKFSDLERKCLMFAHVIVHNKHKSRQIQLRTRRESMTHTTTGRRKSFLMGSANQSGNSVRDFTHNPHHHHFGPHGKPFSRAGTSAALTNFIVRDGKVIPLPSIGTSEQSVKGSPRVKGRRRSSAKSIELATLE